MYSDMFFSTEKSAKSFDEGKVVKMVKMAKYKMAATKYVCAHLWQYLNLQMECQSKFKVWVSGLEEHNRDNCGAFGQNKIKFKIKMAVILKKYTNFYLLLCF
jgi:hypothetical protein